MRRKFLLKVMILSLLFVAMGGGDLFAQSVTTVTSETQLASALAAGGNVALGASFKVDNTIEIKLGKTVTLDLNGYEISTEKEIYLIDNNGDLTIKDGSENKSGGLVVGLGIRNGYEKPARSIAAELTIYGGTFKNIYPDNGAAVYNQGQLFIYGGNFYGQNVAISNDNAIARIYGGYIDGYKYAITNTLLLEITDAQISGVIKTTGSNASTAISDAVTFYEARIGEPANYTSYKTFAEALTAAGNMTGDVTVDILEKVTMKNNLSGNYSSIENVAINDYYKEYSEGTLSDKVTLNNVAKAGKYYYESITAAFAAVQDGETVTMLHDVNLSESIKVNNNITLDLNGKTITGTDNETGSFALFEVQPSKELTVKDENNTGKITLTATNNRGWNAYSSVISNQRGKLTVNGGTIEHLGGTDMAYAIDNLTNGKGTSAITTIKGGTIESKYIGIRQFLNGVEATNELNITAGSINGENSAIYFQSPSAKANTGTLVITSATPIINNRIYMDVTEGATEWPVEVSIDASALAQGVEIVTSNIPAGYELKEIDGVYSVYHGVAKIGNNYYDDLSSALKAITSGCTLDILTDITIASDWDCRNTGAKIIVPVTINGNGKTIKFTGKISDGYNHLAAFRFEAPVTVENLTVDMSEAIAVFQNRFSAISTKANLTVNKSKFIGSTTYANSRAIIFGEGGHEGLEIVVNETEFINWKYGVVDNMNGGDVKSVTITGNKFDNANVQISALESITFTGNTTDSDVQITSYTANNTLNVTAKNNNLATDGTYTVNAGGTLDLQDEFLTPVADVNGKIYFTLQDALNYAVIAADEVTVTLLDNINLEGKTWTPVYFNSYIAEGTNTLIIDGKDKTVSNLTDMLFSGTWTGTKLEVKNLTISKANIKHDADDANNVGVGAIVGNISATDEVVFNNVKLVESHVEGGHWTGGLIGYAAGYSKNDGPVFTDIVIKNCQIIGSTIVGKGSVGGVVGHATGDAWTSFGVETTTISNNTITSTGSSDNKAGIVMGTIGTAGQETTTNGITHTGGVFVSVEETDNTAKSNETIITTIYGRQGSTGGVLTLTIGGSYENYPIEENVEYAQVAPGFKLEQNTNDTYGVVVDPEYGMQAKIVKDGTTTYYTTIVDAITAAQPGETVTILDGEYTADITINKAITVEGERDAEGNNLVSFNGKLNITADGAKAKNLNVNNGGNTAGYIYAKDVLVEGCDVTGGNGFRYCYTTGTVTFKDSKITGATYGIHFDGYEGGNIVIDNCDIIGWTSFAGTITNVAITNTEFLNGNYNQLRFYQNAQMTNCTFNPNMTIDFGEDDVDAAFTNCSVTDGSPLTDVIYLGDIAEMGVDVTINSEPVIVEAKVADNNGDNASYFLVLQEALNAAQADQTVIVISDVELENTLTVAAGKVVTLDLNGKTVSMNDDSAATAALLKNNGNLTIDDSSADDSSAEKNGKLTFKSTIPSADNAYASNTISNHGTITILGGTIENTTVGGACYALDNYAGSTATIEGGKLTAKKTTVRIFNWTDGVAHKATLNVSGGEIYSEDGYGININSGNVPYVDLNISGGVITTDDTDYDLAVYVVNKNNAEYFNVNITDGTFNGNVAINEVATKTMKEDAVKVTNGTFNGAYGVFSYADNAVAVPVISITGGTFATDYSEAYALDDGYEFVKDETTGRFGLQQLQGLTISTLNELIAFRNAVNAGNTFEGQTVVLSGNVDLAPTRAAAENWIPIGTSANPFKGTFDGGNNTISNLNVVGENNVGLFGYATEANIKNVKIVNANVKGTDCVAALIGQGYASTYIDNCHVSGSIK